jgi:hypothetical protein
LAHASENKRHFQLTHPPLLLASIQAHQEDVDERTNPARPAKIENPLNSFPIGYAPISLNFKPPLLMSKMRARKYLLRQSSVLENRSLFAQRSFKIICQNLLPRIISNLNVVWQRSLVSSDVSCLPKHQSGYQSFHNPVIWTYSRDKRHLHIGVDACDQVQGNDRLLQATSNWNILR